METTLEENRTSKGGISADALKWIAIITMLIDHIGAAILENGFIQAYPKLQTIDFVLRLIGRIAFPIFCFQIIEGFAHTRNLRNYILRLFVFALLSEIPFDFAFRGEVGIVSQNVFFTLFIGLVAITVISKFENKQAWLRGLMTFFVSIVAMGLAEFLRTDYGAVGVFLILVLYYFQSKRILQCTVGAVSFLWEPTSLLSFVLFYFYNGRRTMKWNKYFFYLFYPGHLLILYGLFLILKQRFL